MWEWEGVQQDLSNVNGQLVTWLRYIDNILLVGDTGRVHWWTYKPSSPCSTKTIRIYASHMWSASFHWSFLMLRFFQMNTAEFAQMYIVGIPQLMLHDSSFHPQHTIRSIPVGQFLHIRQICETDARFEERARILKSKFLQCGYRTCDEEKAYQRSRHRDPKTLLVPKRFMKKDREVIRGSWLNFGLYYLQILILKNTFSGTHRWLL